MAETKIQPARVLIIRKTLDRPFLSLRYTALLGEKNSNEPLLRGRIQGIKQSNPHHSNESIPIALLKLPKAYLHFDLPKVCSIHTTKGYPKGENRYTVTGEYHFCYDIEKHGKSIYAVGQHDMFSQDGNSYMRLNHLNDLPGVRFFIRKQIILDLAMNAKANFVKGDPDNEKSLLYLMDRGYTPNLFDVLEGGYQKTSLKGEREQEVPIRQFIKELENGINIMKNKFWQYWKKDEVPA